MKQSKNKLVVSKNKNAVRKFAIRDNRKFLWIDLEGKWHAAKDRNSVPTSAILVEKVDHLNF